MEVYNDARARMGAATERDLLSKMANSFLRLCVWVFYLGASRGKVQKKGTVEEQLIRGETPTWL